MAGKLPASILVALGLTGTGCNGDDTETGPCLDVSVDTGDSGSASLDVPDEAHPADAVLDRGVLPDDVADLLRRT